MPNRIRFSIKTLTAAVCFLMAISLNAQDPLRFSEQVDKLVQAEYTPSENLILFTGSSSVRIWDLKKYFPDKNVLNHGFGGSTMSDLAFFLEPLVLDFAPDQVLIYEGDNDLAAGIAPKNILKTTKKIVRKIRKKLPSCEIVIIAAKPSVARENLKSDYEKLNALFIDFVNKKEFMQFADVWSAMLKPNGQVMEDIFLEDNLHMNEKGYVIWTKVIGPYLSDTSGNPE